MLKKFALISLMVILLSATYAPLRAGESGQEVIPINPSPSAETGQPVNETPSAWFVQFASDPTTEGGNPTALNAELNDFKAQAASLNLQYTQRFTFQTLWNGVSITVKPSEVSKLYRIPGVKAIFPVVSIPLDNAVPEENPELAT